MVIYTPRTEDLLNVNRVESITRVSSVNVIDVMVLLIRIVIPDSEVNSKLHVKNDTVLLVIVHITCSLSPTWQTSALGEGNTMAAPTKLMKSLNQILHVNKLIHIILL